MQIELQPSEWIEGSGVETSKIKAIRISPVWYLEHEGLFDWVETYIFFGELTPHPVQSEFIQKLFINGQINQVSIL